MFKIENGREAFYQWDSEQRLIVKDDSIKEVHFCNRTDDCSLPCEVYKENGLNLVNVPNILLQNDWDINVYGYDTNYTKYDARFKVKSRTKPADYVYTETELCTVQQYVEKALEEAKESGDFTGPAGPQGPAGSVGFKVVTELPTEDIDSSLIYLKATEGTDGNRYTEYIYINGAWEVIGTIGVSVDLTDYVKFSDRASTDKAGVVMVDTYQGTLMVGKYLSVYGATNTDIKKKEQLYRPITPKNLDYAVKVGVTTNTYTLTDEEKAAAKQWLGIGKTYTFSNFDYEEDSKLNLPVSFDNTKKYNISLQFRAKDKSDGVIIDEYVYLEKLQFLQDSNERYVLDCGISGTDSMFVGVHIYNNTYYMDDYTDKDNSICIVSEYPSPGYEHKYVLTITEV